MKTRPVTISATVSRVAALAEEGVTPANIAERTGLPIRSVYNAMAQARKRGILTRYFLIHGGRAAERAPAPVNDVDPPDDADPIERPKTRGDCVDGPRPCPFVSCRYHLMLDINPHTGGVKINHPDLEVDQLRETCALDVADRGGVTLEEVGQVLNLTRERARQIEVAGLRHVRQRRERKDFDI